jgi:hypothetical protein
VVKVELMRGEGAEAPLGFSGRSDSQQMATSGPTGYLCVVVSAATGEAPPPRSMTLPSLCPLRDFPI